MLGNIVVIDDDEAVRRTYKRRLRRIFGTEYIIECPELTRTLEEMLVELDNIPDKVTYFIDEDLLHAGIAAYKGTELIEKIRMNDPNIPIYFITSDLTRVDEQLGDVEFAIDKNRWEDEKDKYAQRFLRHINTFRTIKSEQAKRFDELFAKSLIEPLTEQEKEEYDELNVVRSKTLINEAIISEASVSELDRQSKELEGLYAELKAFKDGNDAE
jgi:hypothetical protein